MQFKVPQFLDIEDKIFGPFTFRQFVYLAGGAGLCFVLYRLLGFLVGIIPILGIASFMLALTFYRPNNKPFINMIEAAFKYLIGDKLYVWDREHNTSREGARSVSKSRGKEVVDRPLVSKLSGSKLKDLAWSLDVLDLNKNAERENVK